MLTPMFGILCALVVNVALAILLDPYYYQEHKWPKLGVLVMSGSCLLFFGLLLKR